MRRVPALAAALTATVLAGAASPAGAAPAAAAEVRVIVRLQPGSDVAAEARAAAAGGAEVSRLYSRAIPGFAARVPEAALPGLRRNPRVLAVDPDADVKLASTQPTSVWGLDRIDQRSLPLSGTVTYPGDGAGVTSYVVDTGILAGHVEFGARVRAGYTSVADGRGTADCNGHGTHVAGTVGGETYGVARATELVAVRVLDCTGSGSVSGIIAALDWLITDHQAGVPAVANLSLGTPANSSLDAAVQAVIDDGVLVVAAAGNSSADACTYSPGRLPAALTVGATDSTDAQAWFSNHGSCLDLYAPGVGIPSAWHSSTTAAATSSGTSMAAPHAAGTAAVLLSAEPALSPAEVASRLVSTSTADAVTGASSGSPNRLLHLTGATEDPVTTGTTPSAPTILAARRRNASALVSWTPGDSGGSVITGYDIRVFDGSTVSIFAVTGEVSSAVVSGLRNGRKYTFRVAARNAMGLGAFSTGTSSAIPATRPNRPVVGAASSGTWGGAVTAQARWSAGFAGGTPIRGYRVRALRISVSGRVMSSTTSQLQYPWKRSLVMVLPKGRYQFQVLAINSVGSSHWSARSGKVTAR